MTTVTAYGVQNATAPVARLTIERRAPQPNDVLIDILYCGICHSDIHQARDEWGGGSLYPMVPGHEVIGRVAQTGSAVTGFKTGDLVGVGCFVDSCRQCASCHEGLEQYCESGMTPTYNGQDARHGGLTYGGYSQRITVDADYVLRVPDTLDPAAAAPLLCAGITLYSPLRHWQVQPNQKVGIVGLGGLGHMGVKLAAAMGAHVVMITTSAHKAQDAKKLGAAEVLISKDSVAMAQAAGSFDLIIDTVPVAHDLNPYIALLKRDKTLVIVGPLDPVGVHGANLILRRRQVAGSVIGGIRETQEMLDFCGKHGIVSEVEVVPAGYINEAYERMLKSDVKYRFVIDIASMQS
ncbi:MAG TPA: NAD(P)-dependent alcohol dehydrogenase [Hyphomicrobiales bacterium]|nr:NAD(P)-dependent alcohol dehydrogenase [Hyphomicrobiales bacterium]